eukprot:gene12979-26603_t
MPSSPLIIAVSLALVGSHRAPPPPACAFPPLFAKSGSGQLAPPSAPITQQSSAKYADALRQWRTNCTTALKCNASIYKVEQLQWTQTSYIQPQIHPYDLYFFDPDTLNYTVPKYLADLKQRYGGVDAILLWSTFPQLGIDDRNQYDMVRTMPGGVAGVKALIAELHSHGVKVLLAYNPWDTGTRQERCGDGGYVGGTDANPCPPGTAMND